MEEVLNDLKKLSLKGPILSESDSPNSIGRTLRNELKIESTRNEYKGFRINATNLKGNSRFNIISGCVPDWNKSAISSSKELVDFYGVSDETGKYKKKLFCTLYSNYPNSFGLYLKVNRSKGVLTENFLRNNNSKQLLVWDSKKLNEKLITKNKTIFVHAYKLKKNSQTMFHFRLAEFFIKPNFEKFLKMIDYGSISMDHAISVSHETNKAKEQGPLFKITRDAMPKLFDDYNKFDLMN